MNGHGKKISFLIQNYIRVNFKEVAMSEYEDIFRLRKREISDEEVQEIK